jgi:imidazoleglycerol phosphate synthase cyclase subunit
LPDDVLVPHLGWNRVAAPPAARWLATGEAAFANSYVLTSPPAGAAVAWTTHGLPFVAAVEHGETLACQFHPELSADWGLRLLDRWLAGGGPAGSPAAAPAGQDASGADSPDRPPGLIRRIVPCLDVRDGRVVKGVRFQGLRDAGDPAERAAEYERQGADELVVLDVTASPETREASADTVRRVREVLAIPLTVGGGVGDVEHARTLLCAGADKVSVNTAAVARPGLVAELAEEFGTQCVVVAVDARRDAGGWETLVLSGRESAGVDAVEWSRRATELGAGEILLTSWDRDGTRSGCDLELLRAVTGAVPVPVIASGGVGTDDHAEEAFAAGAAAVLAASIFHYGDDTVRRLKTSLAERGVAVRL